MPTIKVVIPGPPMGKPRMTQRDKWAKRPCVMRYRNWADLARLCVLEQVKKLPDANSVTRLSWVAYFEPPAKQATKRLGKLHRQKPDRDNIDKGILDALYKQDEGIAAGSIEKRWDVTARLEITIEYEEQTDVDSRPGGTTTAPEGPRKSQVQPRLGSPRTRRGTRHEPIPVEHLCV